MDLFIFLCNNAKIIASHVFTAVRTLTDFMARMIVTLARFPHSSWSLDALSLTADPNLQSAGFAVIHSFVSGC